MMPGKYFANAIHITPTTQSTTRRWFRNGSTGSKNWFNERESEMDIVIGIIAVLIMLVSL
jgi:hypothetical protein